MGDLSNFPNGGGNASSVVQNFLDSKPEIEFIQCQLVDYSGVIRTRVATKHFVLSLAEKNSPISVQSPLLTAVLVDATLLWEDVQIGEDQMWPDWSSLKILSH